MSLYPSLEDMKVDRYEKAQISFESQLMQSYPPQPMLPTAATAPMYPSLDPTPPPQYTPSNLPYPVMPNDKLALYPSLSDYMGLELSAAVIAANMPEYLQTFNQNNIAQIVPVTNTVRETSNNVIAPISGQSLGLKKAQICPGIREITLCKDASGMVGLRVAAVNSGIFVCLVKKGTPAALGGVRFGDQILQINGVSVAGYSMNQVHDLFRKSDVNGIRVIIRDRPFERVVTLVKDSTGHVGFQYKNGQIIGLIKDSSAAKNGLLTDHHLLEVDGQNVIGLKDKEISRIIESTPNVITVTIIPSFIYTHMIKKMNVNLIKSSMDHSIPNI